MLTKLECRHMNTRFSETTPVRNFTYQATTPESGARVLFGFLDSKRSDCAGAELLNNMWRWFGEAFDSGQAWRRLIESRNGSLSAVDDSLSALRTRGLRFAHDLRSPEISLPHYAAETQQTPASRTGGTASSARPGQ